MYNNYLVRHMYKAHQLIFFYINLLAACHWTQFQSSIVCINISHVVSCNANDENEYDIN
jgi:hypothetical protein